MIIARAAKGAALLLMIFGAVALIGCQAATPGPKGDPGADGADGEPGAQGPQGPAGISVLQAKGDATHSIVINNTGTNMDKLGDLENPTSGNLDASQRFVGGKPPLSFEGRTSTGAAFPDDGELEIGSFQVEVADNGMITLSKVADSTLALTDYTTGAVFRVRATDADEISQDVTVTVRANRPPRRCGDEPTCASSPVDPLVRTSTGDATPPSLGQLPTRPSVNQNAGNHQYGVDHPSIAIVVGTSTELADVAANPRGNQNALAEQKAWNTYATNVGFTTRQYFVDDDTEDATLEITETDDAGAADDNEHIMAELNEDTGALTITGVKSTWNGARMAGTPPESAPAHEPVRLEITATDAGGLSAKTWIYVWVNGAPEADTTIARSNYTIKLGDGDNQTLINNATRVLFGDPEGLTVATITELSSSQQNVVTVDMNAGVLRASPENLGSATITVRARETNRAFPGLGISAAYTAKPGDRDGDGTIDGDDGTAVTGLVAGELPDVQWAEYTFTVTVIP